MTRTRLLSLTLSPDLNGRCLIIAAENTIKGHRNRDTFKHITFRVEKMKFACLLFISVGLLDVEAVTVSTKYGNVQGQSHTLHTGITVNSFLAIPYAKPPVGNLRFAVRTISSAIAYEFFYDLVIINNTK